MRSPTACPKCGNDKASCICPLGSAAGSAGSGDSESTHKKSAIEMMDFNPFLGPLADSDDPRPAENNRMKERFELYLSIGFYRDLDQPDDSQMRYYLYEDRHKPTNEIQTYSSLVELQQALQTDADDREDIFHNNPKVFIEGHGGDDRYGVGGDHPKREKYKHHLEFPGIPTDPSEQIHNDNFDKIINDLREVIHPKPGELFITLEVCNSDNLFLGKSLWDHQKTFLERLSESHRDITFSGTGPWDQSYNDAAVATGTRAPGGVNTPIMSMGGNVWKAGNTVVFYNKFTMNDDISDYQVVIKKSKFSSTQTAKELKINTLNYAAKILENSTHSFNGKKRILQIISENPNIIKMDDLKIIPNFLSEKSETKEATFLVINENKILTKEKDAYIQLVQKILAKGDKADHRDILKIALGLKDFAENGSVVKGSVFEGHDELLDEILANKKLLELVMVACGKVLIATPSNDSLIDLLRSKGISVNSVDEFGMTAMHYAVQNFYIYRDEPLNLIKKLLDGDANVELADQKGKTPYAIAMKHGSKEMIQGGEKLIELMHEKLQATKVSAVDKPFESMMDNIAQTTSNVDKNRDVVSRSALTKTGGFTSQHTTQQRAESKTVESHDSKPKPGK